MGILSILERKTWLTIKRHKSSSLSVLTHGMFTRHLGSNFDYFFEREGLITYGPYAALLKLFLHEYNEKIDGRHAIYTWTLEPSSSINARKPQQQRRNPLKYYSQIDNSPFQHEENNTSSPIVVISFRKMYFLRSIDDLIDDDDR